MKKNDWDQLKEDHEVAYFRGGLAAEYPQDYSIEEKAEILKGMEESTAEVDAALRADFEALPSEMQAKMFEMLVNSGTESPEFWKRILLD